MHSAGYLYIIFLFINIAIGSESTSLYTEANSLDSLLQQYAFKELTKSRTKTGIPYDGFVPSNLTGIEISSLILRTYILRRRGYGYYKEFYIPSGVTEKPYVKKLVLVYQNLANWSSLYYPLPGYTPDAQSILHSGQIWGRSEPHWGVTYTYLTPVLGILAYDARDLYATNVQELDLEALDDPMTIRFPYVHPAPEGSVLKCVYFYSNNFVEFGNVMDRHTCLTRKQGHFSIVAEVKVAPSPCPSADDDNDHREMNSKLWTIPLGFLVFALFGVLFVVVKKSGLLQRRQRLDDSEAVVEPLVGNTKAPSPSEAVA